MQDEKRESKDEDTDAPSEDEDTCEYCNRKGHKEEDCFTKQKALKRKEKNKKKKEAEQKTEEEQQPEEPSEKANYTTELKHKLMEKLAQQGLK